MHPFLRNSKHLLIYLSAWFALGTMFALTAAISLRDQLLPMFLFIVPLFVVIGILGLSSYYLCRVFPLQSSSTVVIVVIFFTTAFIMGAISAAFGIGWIQWLERLSVGVPIELRNKPYHISLWGVGFFSYLLMSAIHYIAIGYEMMLESERQALALKLMAQEAELRALRIQVNPHFLFNSLNSVLSLIKQNTTDAEIMIRRLADFFRKTLKHSTASLVTFQQELEVIEEYLAIESVRFGKRLNVEQQIDPATLQLFVPPLILQPLIENAVRYGVAQRLTEGTIKILSTIEESKLRVVISNPFDDDVDNKTGTGTGLKNVRLRLRTIYGTHARFQVIKENNIFNAELIIPQQQARKDMA